MDNKLKKSEFLIRNILLFFVASFVPKTISFFMVPLYTECLSTEQYGIIDLITTTAQLVMPILTLQVQDAVLRFSMDKEEDPAQVFSIGLWIVLGGFCILLLGTGVAQLLGFVELSTPYIIFFLVHYLIGALSNIMNYFMRAINKIKNITISTILSCTITVGCNLLLLLVFRWGVNGYLLSSILGHLLSLIYLCISARIDGYIVIRNINRKLAKKIVLFSYPMILSAIAWWINTSLDKYILTFFCGVSSAGILAVAYKVPTIVSTLGATVSKASSVSVLQDFDTGDKDGFLGQSYAVTSFLMVFCASALMLLNVPLAKVLFAKDFFQAWKLVPPLLVSATMNYLSQSCQNICIAMNRTKLISNTAMLGAGMNALLNLCMIPVMGAYGAALATAIGFFLVWLMRYVYVKKNTKIKNCGIKESISYAVLWIQMALAYWGEKYILLQIVGLLLLILLYYKEISGIINKRKLKNK